MGRYHMCWLLGLFILAACAAPLHIRNQESKEPRIAWPDERLFDPGSIVLGMALSGGGTRAASFAYGVMKELAAIIVPLSDGRTSNLLREVDYISSVSGGSFTAAFYAIHQEDPDWGQQLEQKVLREDIERGIFLRLLNPANLLPVIFTNYSRTDVAAEYYGEEIFGKSTMAKLPKRPWLILNATDLVTGIRFEFSKEFFSCLGSDLPSFPIGHAVAASSALPVAFKPITLKSFGQKHKSCVTDQDEGYIEAGFTDFYRRNMALRKIKYLKTDAVRYAHLSDGGITDNLGLQGLLERFRDGPLANKLRNSHVKGVLFISVNAATASDTKAGVQSQGPTFLGVIDRALDLMLENATARTATVFYDRLDESVQRGECGHYADRHCLFIDVKFNDMREKEKRDALNAIGTRLRLETSEVNDLIDAGRSVLYCGNGQRNWKALVETVKLFEQEAGRTGFAMQLEESAKQKCSGWPET